LATLCGLACAESIDTNFGLYLVPSTSADAADATAGQLIWLEMAQDPGVSLPEDLPLAVQRLETGRVLIAARAEPWVTASDVTEIVPGRDARGQPTVTLFFADSGAQRLKTLTGQHIGDHIAVVVDNQILAILKIMAPVGDQMMIPEAARDTVVAALERPGDIPLAPAQPWDSKPIIAVLLAAAMFFGVGLVCTVLAVKFNRFGVARGWLLGWLWLGVLAGGYIGGVGVERHGGPIGDMLGKQITIHIDDIALITGAAIGAVLGAATSVLLWRYVTNVAKAGCRVEDEE
jgi:hypothetical protein